MIKANTKMTTTDKRVRLKSLFGRVSLHGCRTTLVTSLARFRAVGAGPGAAGVAERGLSRWIWLSNLLGCTAWGWGVTGWLGPWGKARSHLPELVIRQDDEDRADSSGQLEIDPPDDRVDLGLGKVGRKLLDGLHIVEHHHATISRVGAWRDFEHGPWVIADHLSTR